MHMVAVAILAFLSMVLGCTNENASGSEDSAGNSTTQSAATITPYTGSPKFNADIRPILQAKCDLCHSNANAGLNGNGNAFENFANVRDEFSRIKYQAVNNSLMPRDGNTPLTAVERGILLKWEQDGFPEN